MIKYKLLWTISLFTTLGLSYLTAQSYQLEVEGTIKMDGNCIEFGVSSDNTFIGHEVAPLNDADYARYNTGIGYQAMNKHLYGGSNTAIGYHAMRNDTTGQGNTAIGARSLLSNRNGSGNTAIGASALNANREGSSNTAIGRSSLSANSTGNGNIAVGLFALRDNISGDDNVALGSYAMYLNKTGYDNVASGTNVLCKNRTGYENTVSGHEAMFDNELGNKNTASGFQALYSNYTGTENVAIGHSSLYSNYTGQRNTAIGYRAFYNNEFFGNSTAIGYNAFVSASNQIRLGNAAITSIGGYEPWTTYSDKRLKKKIKKDVPGLAFITQLEPVTYQMDMDAIAKWQETPDSLRDFQSEAIKANRRVTGFIAQEVEATAKKLNYDFDGVDKPKNENDRYGLRYAQFVVPLVKAVQELDEEKQKLTRHSEQMKKDVEDLKTENEYLKKELEAIKSLLIETRNAQSISLSSNPQKAILKQNSPNPFNGNTTISYFIPENYQKAIIEITDARGQLIQTLNIQERGQGQVDIDASQLANGNYFYYLVLDGQLMDSKQMSLVKNR